MAAVNIHAILSEGPDGRTARITRDGEGEAIGAAVFFTPSELQQIGINPGTTASIEFRIKNGGLRVIPIRHYNK